ncbi:type 1 fimbrial protein [Bacteroides sp. 224]|uniref:type 1 fimbrial protein n=1 Tax=Bacteroides sp. 224 TaxID=2302936 RepID=UPI0013D0D9CA|nr:type 1 fimbrial protein [Bacteroides sp. 224]NDV64162.1 type 1 fimbrial protein [Bacteroides sp. 224]
MLFKRFCIVTLVVLLGLNFASTAYGQSTVYFFTGKLANSTCTIKLNGKDIFDLRGPVQKKISPTGPMISPFYLYKACKKKCVFKEEGKALFSVDIQFTDITSGKITNRAGEIQLNLAEGSVHYLRIAPKGLNDVQFKEITFKEADKLLKNKKCISLPEYIEE